MLHQKASFQYSASVDGLFARTTPLLGTSETAHSRVSMVLRTSKLYFDSDAVVARVWTSGPGFDGISSKDVELVVTHAKTGATATIPCGKVSTFEGVRCAALLGKASWFVTTDVKVTVQARIQGTSSVSRKHDAVLAAKPAGESQVKTNGMWLELPSFGVIKGSTFTAVLYVNSQAAKSFALGTWEARITHSAFFTAVRVTSVKYDVVLGSKSATSFVLTSSLKSSFAGDSASDKKHLISSKLEVAVVTFRVEAGFKGTRADFSLFINALSSRTASEIVKKQAGSVFSSGGLESKGVISVVTSTSAGLQAFASGEQELVNVVSLGVGKSPSSRITARIINSCHTTGGTQCSEGDAPLTGAVALGGLTCVGKVSKVLHTKVANGKCVLSFTAAETKGGDIEVVLTLSSFSVSTFFRVWYPDAVQIGVLDKELNKLESGSGAEYQSTSLAAIASFSAGSIGTKLSNVDVTPLVTFQVEGGAASAVVIAGSRVTGKSVASEVVIGCSGGAACSGAQRAKLSVSKTLVKVTGMSAWVFNGLALGEYSETDSSTCTRSVPKLWRRRSCLSPAPRRAFSRVWLTATTRGGKWIRD